MSHPHAHRYSRSHSGCEHLDAEIAKEFCCGVTERRTEGQTIWLTGSSWCVGTLRGFVMDLQNLQYYLSEEQLPLCIMDERDYGIRLFFFLYIYIKQQRAAVIWMGRGGWWCVFNCEPAHLEVPEGHASHHELGGVSYFISVTISFLITCLQTT